MKKDNKQSMLKKLYKDKAAFLSLIYIIILIIVAIFGPFFTQEANKINFDEKNLPPLGFSIKQSYYNIETEKLETIVIKGSREHILGTDDKGRDMLAMLISGARVSLYVGFLATGLAILIGVIIGVVSAYYGKLVDALLMRFTDIMMTFPFFLLLVFIVFIFGHSLSFIILAIGLTSWTGAARIVRSEALSIREREFILAEKALGASDARIILLHIIPNLAGIVIVMLTLGIPGVILAEAALSFIGLGDPNKVSWGSILYTGQRTISHAWWVSVEPGILLFLTVLAFNFLGDWLRDILDPRFAFERESEEELSYEAS